MRQSPPCFAGGFLNSAGLLCVKSQISNLCATTYIDVLYAVAYISGMIDFARTPLQIGTIIQRARKKRNWTQGQLAERSGLRQGTISAIETGSKTTKLNSLLSILAALDLEFRIGTRTKGSADDIEALFA